MTDTTPTGDAAGPALPLQWEHDIEQIPAGGLNIKRAATEAERMALAPALEILSCDSLQVTYRIKRAADDGYRLKGKLTADVVQACVVTLAPVLDTVTAVFAVEFRPADEVRDIDGGNIDLEDEHEIEPIEGKSLKVGRIVFEELVAGLNPYPRRLGAEFTAPEAAAQNAAAAKENPFAVLAKLKEPK